MKTVDDGYSRPGKDVSIMNRKAQSIRLFAGIAAVVCFILWTAAIRFIDVQPIGPLDSCVGFAALNGWFHRLTGVCIGLYLITDWLGLVPICFCLWFAILGFVQLIQRKKLFRVDTDILLLGVFYVIVIAAYLFFEMVAVNYRPVLIDGRLEASYPSSTTLLVLGVMPSAFLQLRRRIRRVLPRRIVSWLIWAFSAFMLIGRAVSGVHWLTDIIGSIVLSAGLVLIYDWACISLRK